MASVIKKGDPYSKVPITVGTIPLGISNVHQASATVNAGAALTFTINVYPDYPSIALWNMLFTVYVDSIDDAHVYPAGSAVLGISHKITVGTWVDIVGSGRVSGRRKVIIHIVNNDVSSHNIIIHFKAFLQTGLSSGDVTA